MYPSIILAEWTGDTDGLFESTIVMTGRWVYGPFLFITIGGRRRPDSGAVPISRRARLADWHNVTDGFFGRRRY